MIPSFSARTIVYKGMLMAPQLGHCYPDLLDERMKSALVLIHSRFSTNTFPSWELAHPYRMIAHNGEINTLRGNVNWMRARESQLASELFGDDLHKVLPVVRPAGSDTANFDNVLELLVLSGRSLPHAMMMMIPEAYDHREDMSDELRGFYAFHGCLTEPWDGPASISFTDGTVIGATLDRNGLRPGRWMETKDGWVVLASETGVLDEPPENVLRKGRLQPGHLFLVDLARGRIVEDEEIKAEIAGRAPYGKWFDEGVVHLGDLPERAPRVPREEPLRSRQLAFGYTEEDMKVVLAPLARNADEPIGSMGNDLALAVLSDQRPLLYSYFKQLFAQVTNPPIDSTREAVVMSVATSVGSERNLLGESPEHAHQLVIEQPILLDKQLEALRQVDSSIFKAHTVDITWPVAEGPAGIDAAIERICREADDALASGVNILILSDRMVGIDRVAIPALLAVSSVHHHLVREGTRLQAGLVIESGEPRDVHQFATLIGYGAAAINPYVMLETLTELVDDGWLPGLTAEEAQKRAIKGIAKGLLKTISKMGISTIPSYCGAQIFEAIGLEPELVDRHFTGTPSRIGGIGSAILAREALDRHARAYPQNGDLLPLGGVYAWRNEGEYHQWNPETISLLQHAVRHGGYESYEQFSKLVNEEAVRKATLRGLLEFRKAAEPLPLDQVEPAEEIVKRFSTGAMSLGSLSREAHETLAIAMNRIGGKSNTGEGGEDPVRFVRDANGDSRRSAIKQVASGRFGVNINYLTNADQLQIKMAQGAKPGEGGQLPGHKVDEYIAKIRFTTPGVGLISPPPHHDIYSIEDLKQLIYDLRCANPRAQVSVKLVSEMGVGTVAAGVAKCNADHVLISGHDGGTGASPLSLGALRRRAVGDRARRDAADARHERPALADLGADRRPAEDRPRRRDRRAPRRRRDGLLDRPARGDGLRDDARLPPEHLPGRDRHPEPGAARAVRGHAGARRELLLLRRRGGPEDHGRARDRPVRGPDRPRRPARRRRGGRALEGPRDRSLEPAHGTRRSRGHPASAHARAGLAARVRARLGADRDRRGGDQAPDAGRSGRPRPEREPDGGRAPLALDHGRSRREGTARRDGQVRAAWLCRPVVRRVARARRRADAHRGRKRLRRQGPLRRHDRDPASRGRDVRGRGERDRRQHGSVRRDEGQGVLPRPRGRAVRRPELGRGRGRRGRRRPRLRVHDRRPCRRPRPHGPQLRGRE